MRHPKLNNAAALMALALAAAAFADFASIAGADTLLVVKSHSDPSHIGMMRQPARDSESKVWVGEKRIRRDVGDSTSILRLDQKKMYLIDNPTKTYHVLDLPIDYRKLNPERGQAAMDQLSAMSKMDVTVTPRDETRKIGSWDTKRYDVVMTNEVGLKVETTMWVSDIGIDTVALTEMTTTMASLKPGTLDWVKKIEAIPGYPVRQEATATMPGGPLESAEIKSVQELVSVEKKDAPAGLYDPPAGYKKTPYDPASRAANGS